MILRRMRYEKFNSSGYNMGMFSKKNVIYYIRINQFFYKKRLRVIDIIRNIERCF